MKVAGSPLPGFLFDSPTPMKALFVSLFLCVGVLGSARAQKIAATPPKVDLFAELPGNNEPSEEKVREMTRAMATALHFNEAQYVRMLAVNRIKLVRLDEIQWQYRDNVAVQQAKYAELQSQYETECSHILSPTQLSALHTSEHSPQALPKADPTAGGVG